jgi:RNA polymerase primary sigma factor
MGKNIFVTKGAINSTADSTKAYMRDIKRVKMIDRDREKELAAAIAQGDRAALNELVSANLRFVAQVARSYQGMGVPMEDLIGFGNIGLFEAATRFDASRNIKFISFAVWYVRAEIQKALNDLSRTVRIPSHRTRSEAYGEVSTDVQINDEDNSDTYGARYLQAEDAIGEFERSQFLQELAELLSQINPKQAEALVLHYGIGQEYPMCMDTIADRMGITGERARQLVRAGEKSLRGIAGSESLLQYA